MSNIYDIRRYGIIGFLVMSIVVVALFLFYSDSLVRDLSAQERSRMQIWADATREIVDTSVDEDTDPALMNFLLSIIEDNTNIPVLLTDADGNILMHRNFRLPEEIDSLAPFELSESKQNFLQKTSRHCARHQTVSR